MNFVELNSDYYNEWDQFIAEIPDSSFYHQSAWFEVLEKTFGYKQVGCLQLDDDNIVGGLPLFDVRRIGSKGIVSSPFRDRGGVLCSSDVNPRYILEHVKRSHGNRADYILVKQMDAFDENVVAGLPYQKSINWITTRLDLSKGAENIWRNLKNNAQGPVKQARKKGVRIRIADSPEEMVNFFRIFLHNRKKLGIPSFPRKFFIRLWDSMQISGNICLMLAYLGEKAIAGVILLIYKNTVIDGYAASLREFLQYRANDFLVWKAIKWACEKDHKVFDFGADSYRQKNLLDFKRKWGGVQKSVYYYYYIGKTGRSLSLDLDSSNPKYTFFRKALSIMPTPMYSFISDRLVSRFG